MKLTSGIMEVDLHGMTVEEAVRKARYMVAKAPASVYTVRLIHGFHGGTKIKDAIENEFTHGNNKKVIRIKSGGNLGTTDLVLRELC
ncbi:MAG: Smr/MutS family protein [Lachnospiraceae bacterium]|nr:Smr/MutS family protein [Lachnospiraceae bacterium]